MEPWGIIGHNIDTCWLGPSLIKLVGNEHREGAVGGGGCKKWQKHTHSVTRDTQDGWSFGQGSAQS